MGAILSQLGHLFLQTIPTVVFVFLLFIILDRLCFRPLTTVLKQREEATLGALARAREQTSAADAKSREYDAALQAARQEIYRQREAERRARLLERENALKKAREQSEALLREAQVNLAENVTEAKKELESAYRSLAEEIVVAVLGPDGILGETGGSQP